jgi:hypothetical protein
VSAFASPPAPVAKPANPWGVVNACILAGREPRVVHHGLARGSMGWARVHVGAESRTSAEKLCANLRAAGASCLGQRN